MLLDEGDENSTDEADDQIVDQGLRDASAEVQKSRQRCPNQPDPH